MGASEHLIGNPGSTASITNLWANGTLTVSGNLTSQTKYFLPPPNDRYNSETLGDYLSELRDPNTGKRFCEGRYDPDILERMLRQSPKVGQALLHAERHRWSGMERGQLRTAIRQCFQTYYSYSKELLLQEFQSFWMMHPQYDGIYRGIRREDIQWLGSMPMPPDYYFPVESESPMAQIKLINIAEKCLPLLAEWCMCCYSFRKMEWTFVEETETIDMSAIIPEPYIPPPKSQEQLDKQAEREKRERMRRNDAKLRRMAQRGKLSEEVEIEVLYNQKE